ncbi:MAG: hypothetical protein P8P71_06230 [Phycisphaerales bacterium]|nr:hypothetical protein [Phycisphaerales bacterium]
MIPSLSIAAIALASLLAGSASASTSPAIDRDDELGPATRRVAIDGSSLGGFVLPILPVQHDLEIDAKKATRWSVDDTQRLVLEGDVEIVLGTYAFRADLALVWINRLPTKDGLVTQAAFWFPEVSEPTRRAGLGASGRDVLVTATIDGKVALRTILLEDGPIRNTSVARGEQRLARYLRTLAAPPLPKLGKRLDVQVPPKAPKPVLEPGGRIVRETPTSNQLDPTEIELPVQGGGDLPIFDPRGLVSFNADETVVDEDRDAIIVLGSVVIDYDGTNTGEDLRRLSLVSDRGVVFLVPGTIKGLREGTATVEAESITGIFLEGAVRASDGDYTMRGSSIYYDLPRNRATIMDAVLRTYSRRGRNLPVYARAEEMRQLSTDQWTADRATISTSEFFTPHLSIGLERVTVTERPDAEGSTTTWVKGDGLTMNAGGIPFFYWPGFEGTADEPPLKGVRSGFEKDKGFEIGTTWDLFRMLGIAEPDWVAADLLIDGFLDRGPAVGLDLDLSGIGGVSGYGAFDLYGLYDFGGTDRTSAGEDVEIAQGLRGQAVGEYRAVLSADLYLEAQLSYLSDQTWATSWREREYDSRREYETSFYFDYSPDNTSLSLLAKTKINDFLSNGWLIASQPYQVEKMPEILYDREGDDILETVTWSSTYGFSSMRLSPTAGSAASLGVESDNFATTDADASVASLYEGAGYNDDVVQRFHTRQEFTLPISGEGWNVSPFVFGRFTGYLDGNWEEYREQSGVDTDLDEYRVMLGGGARASTRFVEVDNTARSEFFDVHRLRHIIEPNSTLWWGWDSLPDGAFPLYDQRIEGATGGTVAQIGARHTLQTQRGGPGNRESVDLLAMNYGAVFNDGADDFQRDDLIRPGGAYNAYAWAQSPYPQFFSWEPELSQWGTHGYASGVWQVSSSLAFAGSGLFAWEPREVIDVRDGIASPQSRTINGILRGSVGFEMSHAPDTSSFIEYRYLAATLDELLQVGLRYRVGRLYQFAVSPQYDLKRDEFRAATASIVRKTPDFDFTLTVGYDLIRDETTFGVRLAVPQTPGIGFPAY